MSHRIRGETTDEVFQEQTLGFLTFKIFHMQISLYNTLRDKKEKVQKVSSKGISVNLF